MGTQEVNPPSADAQSADAQSADAQSADAQSADARPGSHVILGVDPGLNVSGYGVIRAQSGQCELVEAGVVRSRTRRSIEERIADIHEGILEVVQQHCPAYLALEQLFSHYSRPKTAILMGHARGVICLAAAQSDVPVRSYEPTKIKKVMTGNGHAPKHQMQQAVKLQLGLHEVPEPADVADALAIAICSHFLSQNPLAA